MRLQPGDDRLGGNRGVLDGDQHGLRLLGVQLVAIGEDGTEVVG